MNKLKTAGLAFVLTVVLLLIVAYPAMLLWNIALVPAISVLNEISWSQAFAIMVLFNLMFKTSIEAKL